MYRFLVSMLTNVSTNTTSHFKRWLYCCLTALFLLPLSTLQAENELSLTRDGAVALALDKNKGLVAARTAIEKARIGQQYAGQWQNPKVKIDYASDWAFNDEGESTFGLSFEQNFPITGRLRLLKDIAQIEIQLAEAEVRNQERLLIQKVENQLIHIASVEAQLQLRQSLLELQQKSAEFMQARIERGEASSFEANQIRIARFTTEQEARQLQAEHTAEIAKLRLLLSIETSTPITLATQLTLPTATPQLAPFEPAQLSDHPQYQLKEYFLHMAKMQTSLALAERWSDIAVQVFFENERSVDEPTGLTSDRFFGLSVSIPLPLHDKNRGAIATSRAHRQQIELERESLALKIKSEAEMFRTQVDSLYQQARHYEQNITTLAAQNLADMNTAYSKGQLNLTDLFRAQEQWLKIQSTHLSLLHDYEHALVKWKAATAQNR